jgi:hypothetical protein
MKIKTVVIETSSKDLLTAEERLALWDKKMRTSGKPYGSVRVKHTLKRVGLDPKMFKIRSSMSQRKGSSTKVNFLGYTTEHRQDLKEKIPALIENGMDVTIMVMDNIITAIIVDSNNPSADPELEVHGVSPGEFAYWTSDEKNKYGRDLYLKFNGSQAIEKAKEYCAKFKVR